MQTYEVTDAANHNRGGVTAEGDILVSGQQGFAWVTADGTQHSLGLGGYLDIGLLDTMKDLFVNFIGAVVFSIIGYFYVKNRGQGKFARRFIPQVLPPEEPSTKEK